MASRSWFKNKTKSWPSQVKVAFVRWPGRVQPLQVEGLEVYLHAYVESRMGEGVRWLLCIGKCYRSLKTYKCYLTSNSYCCLCCFYDLLEMSSEGEQYGFPLQEGISGAGKDWCGRIWLCLQVHQAPWWMRLCHQTLQEASGRILGWVSVLARNCWLKWWTCFWEVWWRRRQCRPKGIWEVW